MSFSVFPACSFHEGNGDFHGDFSVFSQEMDIFTQETQINSCESLVNRPPIRLYSGESIGKITLTPNEEKLKSSSSSGSALRYHSGLGKSVFQKLNSSIFTHHGWVLANMRSHADIRRKRRGHEGPFSVLSFMFKALNFFEVFLLRSEVESPARLASRA